MMDTNITTHDIRKTFSSRKFIPRTGVTSLTYYIRRIQSGYLPSDEDKSSAFQAVLRVFGTNDKYLRHFVCSALPFMLNSNSFMGISVLTKEISRSGGPALRALFKITPPEMLCENINYLSKAYSNKDTCGSAIAIARSLASKQPDLLHGMNFQILKGSFYADSSQILYAELHKSDPAALGQALQGSRTPRGSIALIKNIFHKEKRKSSELLRELLRGSDLAAQLEASRFVAQLTDEDAVEFVDDTCYALRCLLRDRRPVAKLAALRTASQLSFVFMQTAQINREMEGLVSHKNKQIAMLAMEVLVRTGDEKTIDRIAEELPQTISTGSEPLKMAYIDALEKLSSRYPSKKDELLNLLRLLVENQGSLAFKAHVVRACDRFLFRNPEDSLIQALALYIEDSEYPAITTLILKVLGNHLPKSKTPQKYLVSVLNRLILEDYQVRAAALLSLQCMASQGFMREEIFEILHKHCHDSDDYVRRLSEFLCTRIYVCPIKQPEAERPKAKKTSFVMHDGDLKITVHKSVLPKAAKFDFTFENATNLPLQDIKLKVDDEIIELPLLKPQEAESKHLSLEFSERLLETRLQYSIVDEDDAEEENYELDPIALNICDLMHPSHPQHEMRHSQTHKFKTSLSMEALRERLTRILSMRIEALDVRNEAMEIQFTGSNAEDSVRVSVLMRQKKKVSVEVNIESNKEEIIDKVWNCISGS